MTELIWKGDIVPDVRQFAITLAKATAAGAVIGELLNVVISLGTGSPAQIPANFWPSAYVGICFSFTFSLLCGLPWPFLRPYVRHYPASIRFVLVALIGGFTAMLAYTVAALLTQRYTHLPTLGSSGFGTMLVIEALLGAAIALIIGTIKTLRAQIREKELRESTLSAAAAHAQSCALQAQINPHFFFNTLNTLSALIPVDPEAAQQVVSELADMFRYTLACSQTDRVTLAEELSFVKNYLNLEKARFSHRLEVELPHGDFHDIRLPGLSLQPLVENAIRHGIARRIEGGKVQITVHREGRRSFVDVRNPSDGKPVFREGHALANVRDRLRLFAGDLVLAAGNGDVRVTMEIPA